MARLRRDHAGHIVVHIAVERTAPVQHDHIRRGAEGHHTYCKLRHNQIQAQVHNNRARVGPGTTVSQGNPALGRIRGLSTTNITLIHNEIQGAAAKLA